MNEELYMNASPVKKKAADYRRIAREKLKKYYWTIFAVILVAGILGGVMSSGSIPSFSVSMPTGSVEDTSTSTDGATEIPPAGEVDDPAAEEEVPVMALIVLAVVLLGIGIALLAVFAFDLFVGGPVSLGLQRFLLNVMDEENVNFSVLFSYFKICYFKGVLLRLLHRLVLFASTLPFTLAYLSGFVCIVIGLLFMAQPVLMITGIVLLLSSIPLPFLSIVFFYRYIYAETILAEYPEMRPIDALRNSAQIMKGNKWRLFCLEFSFIGWLFLATFCTCGLGAMFIAPYTHTAVIAFYDDITNRRAARETEFPSIDPDDYIPSVEGQQEIGEHEQQDAE